MASPFRVFRKNQKVLLVTFGMAAMFAFIAADPILQWFSSRQSTQKNPVVARWDGGEMTRAQLTKAIQLRSAAAQFLVSAARAGRERTFEEPLVPVVHSVTSPQGIGEGSTIQVQLLAHQATNEGFLVDDTAVNLYLVQLTQGKVSNQELAEMLQGLKSVNSNATQEMVFQSLKTEMLAEQYLRSFLSGEGVITPVEMWIPWNRLNDLITIETLAIPVADFINQVEDPTEKELQEFFNKHKDTVKGRSRIGLEIHESPEPGFREPEKVRLQYLLADFDAFVDQIHGEVTDEEVKAHYEEFKDQYELIEFAPSGDDLTDGVGSDEIPSAPEPNDPKSDSPAADASKETADESPAEESSPEASKESADESTNGDSTTDEKPSDGESLATGSLFRSNLTTRERS